MILRWLFPLGILLSLSAFVSADEVVQAPAKVSPAPRTAGYLLIPGESGKDAPCRYEPYQPQPGDILLYDCKNRFYHVIYKMASTKAPIHVAMAIALEDGSPALLELTGPRVLTAKVVILDVEPRLSSYEGTVMVRRLRRPLTPEQSRDLTCFAQAQVGKSFAVPRIFLQVTPFNPHKGLRRTLFGKTYLDRDRWFCSEMVVAAGTAAQVFDPNIHFANATYPRDLAFDETMDLSALYYPPVPWSANAPERLIP